jgi:hypothetical protein
MPPAAMRTLRAMSARSSETSWETCVKTCFSVSLAPANAGAVKRSNWFPKWKGRTSIAWGTPRKPTTMEPAARTTRGSVIDFGDSCRW